MHPLHPAEVHDIWAEDAAMTVYAPTARITGRGDTLNRPLVTATYSSPAPDVIRVRLEHHRGAPGGDRGPAFALDASSCPVQVAVDDDAGVLTSGGLSVRVHRGDGWRVEFTRGGEVITSSTGTSVGFVSTDSGEHHVHEQLAIGVGEHLYGLGERFGAFVKNGQSVDIWNADGGTSSEQAYRNVPFYRSDRGYGVFVDHPGRSPAGRRGCRSGRSACGCRRRPRPITTRRPSPATSRACASGSSR